MFTRKVVAVAGMGLCGAWATAAWGAAAPQWLLGAGVHYSDNIAKTPTNPQKEWIRTVLAGLQYQQNSQDVQANVRGYLEYLNYLHGTYPNETRGTLNAKVLWHQVPDRLVWDVEDYYSQAPENVFAADTPANRQNANVFVLGPEVRFTPWAAGDGAVGVRYTDIYFQTSPTDNRRWSGYLRLDKYLSRTTRLGGHLQSEWTDFRNQTVNSNFRRYDGWLSLDARAEGFGPNVVPVPGGLGAGIDIGASRFVRDRGNDKSGYLLRAHLETNPHGVWRLNARGRSQLTDSSADLLTLATAPPSTVLPRAFNLLDLQVSGAIYRERVAEVDLTRAGEINSFTISGNWRRETYINATQLDRTVKGGGAAFTRRLGPTTTGTIFGARSRQDLTNTGENDDDWLAGIRLTRQLSMKWWLNFDALHEKRDSSIPAYSFVENRGYLILSYGQNIVTGY